MRVDKLNQKKWVASTVSHLHTIMIVSYVFYIFTHSSCEGSYNFIWFFNDECFLKPDQRFVYCSLITAAYLSNDFWVVVSEIGVQDKLSKQLLVHHVVATVGIIGSVFAGYSYPGMTCLMLLVEISNIFLDLKLLMLKDEYNQLPAKICFLCFLITYVMFRIILMPIINLMVLKTLNLVFTGLQPFRQMCMLFSALQSLILTCLMYYWFFRVIKTTAKILGFGNSDLSDIVNDKNSDED